MTNEERKATIEQLYSRFLAIMEFYGVHVPAIVLCVHGAQLDETRIITKDSDMGQRYKSVLVDVIELSGGEHHSSGKINLERE